MNSYPPEHDNNNQEDDTRPTMTVPIVTPDAPKSSGMARLFGGVFLLAALGFTLASGALLLQPTQQQIVMVTSTPTQPADSVAAPTDSPTQSEQVDTSETIVQAANALVVLPTLSAQEQVALLSTPIYTAPTDQLIKAITVRDAYQPFTIIPDRPRNRVEEYTIEKGDTINSIAQKFGLTQETIAWSNDRREIWLLTTGAKLYILPVDGVYHQVVGNATIRQIAAQYNVDDPNLVISSEFNNLRGYAADDVPPSGLRIVIPGGVAEAINWSPTVQTSSGGGAGGGGGGSGLVSFEPGAPGSCAPQAPGVATGGWQRPLNIYTFMRGYTAFHSGVDLAASTGTPVGAANGGTVIFAGRSNWGFGLLVVISHGPFSTLYGHLNSVNVRCGAIVSPGQMVGTVGSTGNSSGPHLHFEVQYNGIPSNPAGILPF